MRIEQLINLMIMMFILIGLGFIVSKKRIINAEVKQGITWLVLNIILPCNIFNSFQQTKKDTIMNHFISIIIISMSIQIGCYILSKVLFTTFTKPKKAVLQYATICSNAGFIGNPVAEGLYGSIGLLYASIYLIPQRIVMWSAGISCFTEAKGKQMIQRIITHPCIIAVILGIVVMVFSIPIPVAITNTIKTIGVCNTTMSMLLIGAILTTVNFKTIVTMETIFYSVIRVLLIPLFTFIGCYFMKVDAVIAGVSIILAGMPAGATTAILATQYQGDEQFAAKCIILSTVASLVTIPFWSYLIFLVF